LAKGNTRGRSAGDDAAGARVGEGASGRGGRAGVVDVAAHRQVAAVRKELHSLVGAWSRRTGQPHPTVHAELRRTCGGPEVPLATKEQLEARVATLRSWFVVRRS